jgi:hypothetical protein
MRSQDFCPRTYTIVAALIVPNNITVGKLEKI